MKFNFLYQAFMPTSFVQILLWWPAGTGLPVLGINKLRVPAHFGWPDDSSAMPLGVEIPTIDLLRRALMAYAAALITGSMIGPMVFLSPKIMM